jgi:glycosyltransferase involved in cell wall biosynthesis
MRPRNILIVHQNFPGQFPHIAAALAARGDRVVAIGGKGARDIPGVELRRYALKRSSSSGIPNWLIKPESDLIRAEGAVEAAFSLRNDGFVPDAIVGHAGFGELAHMREVFPEARIIALTEMFYRSRGFDTGFDPEFSSGPDLANQMKVNAMNAGAALTYALADTIVCPTPFQASTFPPSLRERIIVHHEGIDVPPADRPRPKVRLGQSELILDGSQPLVTYVSRTLEPARGFHTFMRALPAVMAARPDAQVVVLGYHGKSGYGTTAPNDATWLDHFQGEAGDRIDQRRFHAIGVVDRSVMLAILSHSWAHVYLTIPFVLSWSLLEAMACECAIIASDTAPVHDAIVDGREGKLVDFFDADQLAASIIRTLDDQGAVREQRARARQTTLEKFDRATVGVPGWLKIIDDVLAS